MLLNLKEYSELNEETSQKQLKKSSKNTFNLKRLAKRSCKSNIFLALTLNIVWKKS